jgi:phospholipid/cholesterol/gamma-HCH transport system substrate-binding protein
MPSTSRVRWAQLRVGVTATVAFVILGVLIWLLTSQKPIWQQYSTIYTYMRDSAALARGAPVRLNGILIGSVEQVDLSRSTNPDRAVRVAMKVLRDRVKDIPSDSTAGISAENVLGTKFINITRGRSPQAVRVGGELPGESSAEIEDLVRKGFGLFDSAQAILVRADRIIGLIESGKGSIGKFLVDDEFYSRLVATVAELQKVSTTIGSGKGTVGKLLYDDSLYNEARSAVSRLDDLMADLQSGQGTAGKLLKDPALYNDTRASIAEFRKILDDINAGKGTAGKLLKDEAAYRQIQSVLGKIDTTLDKVNSGQGTIGQLLVNPQLYDSVNGFATEMEALVKDVRANPKKFLRIKMALF